eukprot:365557-Chlamydomonas_euryale.AAC.8
MPLRGARLVWFRHPSPRTRARASAARTALLTCDPSEPSDTGARRSRRGQGVGLLQHTSTDGGDSAPSFSRVITAKARGGGGGLEDCRLALGGPAAVE